MSVSGFLLLAMTTAAVCGAEKSPTADARLKDLTLAVKKVSTREDQATTTREIYSTIDMAIADDEYEIASKAANLALDLAISSTNQHLTARAKARKEEIQVVAKEFEAVSRHYAKLKLASDDPYANRKVGLFIAAMKGDWKKGAVMLSKSGSPVLVKIGGEELKGPQGPGEQLELASDWKSAAEGQSPPLKLRMLKRAYYWAELAYRNPGKESKPLIDNRLSELPLRYLSDMPELELGQGAWGFGKYGSRGADAEIITLDGIPYPFGLGMHPEEGQAFIVKYELKGAYKTLTTGCGVNGSSPGQSSPLIFTVLGDGRQLWKSAPIKTLTDAEFPTINVKGVKVLELRTECTAGRDGGHAVWLDPLVSK